MKRWLLPRFRLRTLLVLTTIASLALAGWQSLVRPYRDQVAAVANLQKAGATVSIDALSLPAWRKSVLLWSLGPEALIAATSVSLSDGKLPPDFAEQLSSLPFVVELTLDRTDFDDADARALVSSKRQLRRLSLCYTRLTDAGLAASVSELSALEELRLTGLSGVTNAGLASIAELPFLRKAYLRWTAATPEGIDAFRAAVAGRVVHTQLGG